MRQTIKTISEENKSQFFKTIHDRAYKFEIFEKLKTDFESNWCILWRKKSLQNLKNR